MVDILSLPHRLPFLFLDRIQEIVPGERGTFVIQWSSGGHYQSAQAPDSFSQALLLEAMAEGAGIILISASGQKDEPSPGKGYLLRLDRVFFEALPQPGQEICVVVNKTKVFGQMVQFQAQAKSGDLVIARAELTLWCEPREQGQEAR